MNLIICDENCRYKQDGYCSLNHIASITADVTAKCGYFEACGVNVKQKARSADSTQEKSLRHRVQ